jgi:hypothetical protein
MSSGECRFKVSQATENGHELIQKVFKFAAVWGGVVAISIGLTELALWTFDPLVYQTHLKWQPDGHIRGRLVPNQSFQTGAGHNPLLPNRDDVFTNRVNKYGFRGPDYPLSPKDNTVRIAVFGGSATFNYHDAEEKTWPKLLERCLAKKSQRRIKVINLALPGFHMGISKINYLQNGRPFSPKIAIAYHTWNDLEAMYRITEDPLHAMFAGVSNGYRRAGLIEVLMKLEISKYSQILRHVRIAYYNVLAAYRQGRPITSGTRRPSEFSRELFIQDFEDFVYFAKRDGVVPVLSSQGSLISAGEASDKVKKYIGHGLINLDHSTLVEEHAWATRTIARTAEQNDAVFVNVYSAIPHTTRYFEDHVHITSEGQAAVADVFCRTMLNDGRILTVLAGAL